MAKRDSRYFIRLILFAAHVQIFTAAVGFVTTTSFTHGVHAGLGDDRLFAVWRVICTQNGFSLGVDVAGADRLMITHKASFTFPLPFSYGARIRAVPGVRDVTHATWFGGYYQEESNFLQMFPVEASSYLTVYSDYVVSQEDRERWQSDRTGALIGRAYAERFGWKIGDRVPLRSNIYRRTDGSDMGADHRRILGWLAARRRYAASIHSLRLI